MLRARDEMDRRYAEPLDVPTLAAIAHLSASQFGRVFKDVYGETPHRYLQRRRVERAMTLLRQTDRPVTDIAWDVGFASLGTFSRTFSTVVGCSPSEFRAKHEPVHVPTCFIAAWTRPRDSAPGRETTGRETTGRETTGRGGGLRDSGFGEAGHPRR
jgi:AraC-like DNA-binding protein